MCLGKTDPSGPCRCPSDAQDRLDAAEDQVAAAERDYQAASDELTDDILTTVMATPWRPESKELFDATGYDDPAEAQEFMEWRDTALDSAQRHGVRITASEDVQGMWRGEGEPSVRMEVEGPSESVASWADFMCARYAQDSVLTATPVPDGTPGASDCIAISNDDQAATLIDEIGIEGYTLRDGEIEIIAPSNDTADLLEDMSVPHHRHAIKADFRTPSEEDRRAAEAGGPNKKMQAIRSKYMKEKGFHHEPLPDISDQENMDAADLYYDLPDIRTDPSVLESYESFNDHIAEQYNLLIDNGYTLEPKTDGDSPYGNYSSEMMKDVRDNKHLHYYPSEGAGSDLGDNHPMSEMIDVDDGEGGTRKILANDAFRAVHDAFAHCDGHSFGPRGEKRAWWAHRATLPEKAHLALWNETRAQNVWTNFGPHMRNENGSLKSGEELGKYKDNKERPYAEQRVVDPRGRTLV